MIHKFWNVRLAPHDHALNPRAEGEEDATTEERAVVRETEEKMEEKVYRIWSVLSTFEESSAACISDMLLHVSNGAYVDGVVVARKFIWHVDIQFHALDRLDSRITSAGMKGLWSSSGCVVCHAHCCPAGMSYAREAKLLCKKIVAFFSFLSKTQDTGVRKLGSTQELLSLVTGLAHYLKLLIRISLQGALKLEREKQDLEGLQHLLDELSDLDPAKERESCLDLGASGAALAAQASDLCMACNTAIEDECAKMGERRWHINCANCANCTRELGRNLEDARWSGDLDRLLCQSCAANSPDPLTGFEHITKLEQYVYLLRVALARLLARLRASGTLPHTSGTWPSHSALSSLTVE